MKGTVLCVIFVLHMHIPIFGILSLQEGWSIGTGKLQAFRL